uniref:Putative secreted protein n=1 Tax=Ixodes ricinus TaxID=34613 RepID=A0A147BFC8_IXORI
MLSMMVMSFFSLPIDSCSLPLVMKSLLKPGIMPMIWLKGPIFMMFWNCSYMSRSVNSPCFSFSISSSLSSSFSSFTLSMRPSMSPMPSSLLMKGFTLKGSKSSMCSPVPMKMIGLCVAATALRAPPPLA